MAVYTVGDWFAHSVATYYEQPILIGVGFFIGVSSLMAPPFYMAWKGFDLLHFPSEPDLYLLRSGRAKTVVFSEVDPVLHQSFTAPVAASGFESPDAADGSEAPAADGWTVIARR